jgi:hypothetical protein
MMANSRTHYLPEPWLCFFRLLTLECYPYAEFSLAMEVRALVGWVAAAGWAAPAAGRAMTRMYNSRQSDAFRSSNSTTGKHTHQHPCLLIGKQHLCSDAAQ